jgi:hypothetical protein
MKLPRPPRKTIWKLAALGTVLVLAAGLIIPFIDATRFSSRVRAGLEEALGRRVDIGKVRLDLFNGPGFTADNVVIHEDPQVGLEPFAYVESVEARVSLLRLWAGRLEFSKLRLVNPRINLARPRSGDWDVEKLLAHTMGAPSGAVRLPEIQVRGGRINFKSGNTKSIFYIAETSLDAVPPPSPGGEWRFRFEGQPARTDRAALGFGNITARGRWLPEAGTGGRVDVTFNLESRSLAELVRLIHGHDIGVHGQVTSSARLSGPVSGIQISGRMQVTDIHRWDQLPPYSDGWSFDYSGRLDLVSQTLDASTVPPPEGDPSPVSGRLRASGYFNRPLWGVLVTVKGLPLAPVPEIARHMGQPLPQSLALDGNLTGVLGYSPETGIRGKLVSGGAEVKMPDSPVIRLEDAELLFDGPRVLVSSTALRLPAEDASTGDEHGQKPQEEATLRASYTWSNQTFDAVIASRSMAIPAPGGSWARLLGAVPLVRNLREGVWRGELSYHQQGELPGSWTGTVYVEGTRVPLPGFADTLELDRARVAVKGGEATLDRIIGRLGTAELSGEYSYREGAARPHQFRVSVDELRAGDLERLLLPALRREESFLTRALRLGRPRIPEWLAALHADGVVEAGTLSVGALHLSRLRARLRWDATAVEMPELSVRWGNGAVSGQLTVSLRRAAPVYRLNARFKSVNWMGGAWEGRALLQTSGTSDDLLRNLRVEGDFEGRSVELAPEIEFKSLSGHCVLAVAGDAPRLRLTNLQAVAGDTIYKGKGATGEDGRIHLDLTDGHRQVRIAATAPFASNPEN